MGLSHSPSIVTDGLVLALDAANVKSYPGTGDAWTDLSGNGNTGKLENGPIYDSANSGSILFDGTNDYVDCGPASQIGSSLTGFTFNVWINTSVKAVKCIAENGTGYTTNTFYMFQENANYITFEVYGGTDFDVVYTNFIYQTNTWYNLTGVWSPNTRVEIYCNGILCSGTRGGSARSSLRDGNADLFFGARPGSNSYRFSGKIANSGIYNRALTAAEIQQNFNALRGRYSL